MLWLPLPLSFFCSIYWVLGFIWVESLRGRPLQWCANLSCMVDDRDISCTPRQDSRVLSNICLALSYEFSPRLYKLRDTTEEKNYYLLLPPPSIIVPERHWSEQKKYSTHSPCLGHNVVSWIDSVIINHSPWSLLSSGIVILKISALLPTLSSSFRQGLRLRIPLW